MWAFVRMKAWLLFVLMALCPAICSVLVLVTPRGPRVVGIALVVLAVGMAVGIPLAWVWSAGWRLRAHAGMTSRIPLVLFNASALIQLAFWLSLATGVPTSSVAVSDALSAALPTATFVGAVFCALFVVKSLVLAEKRDCGLVYVLVFAASVVFAPWLAVWMLQPRINRVFEGATPA